jgi:hypothetical protein
MTSQTSVTEPPVIGQATSNQVKRPAPEDKKQAELEPLWKKSRMVSFGNGEYSRFSR